MLHLHFLLGYQSYSLSTQFKFSTPVFYHLSPGTIHLAKLLVPSQYFFFPVTWYYACLFYCFFFFFLLSFSSFFGRDSKWFSLLVPAQIAWRATLRLLRPCLGLVGQSIMIDWQCLPLTWERKVGLCVVAICHSYLGKGNTVTSFCSFTINLQTKSNVG